MISVSYFYLLPDLMAEVGSATVVVVLISPHISPVDLVDRKEAKNVRRMAWAVFF